MPKLQQVVKGLFAGIQASMYIGMLLVLVFYIFAVAGIIFFMPNDPYHFRNIPNAMMSLFRGATLEVRVEVSAICLCILK